MSMPPAITHPTRSGLKFLLHCYPSWFGPYSEPEQTGAGGRRPENPAGRGDVPAAPVMRRHYAEPDAARNLNAENKRLQQCSRPDTGRNPANANSPGATTAASVHPAAETCSAGVSW
jgi:hypothetical protein